jgi:hypothetical protein
MGGGGHHYDRHGGHRNQGNNNNSISGPQHQQQTQQQQQAWGTPAGPPQEQHVPVRNFNSAEAKDVLKQGVWWLISACC